MLKAGDHVRVIDGSYSKELIDGEWKSTCPGPASPDRKGEIWMVLATGGNLPTASSPIAGEIDNDVLLVDPYQSNRLLATRERFVERVDPLGLPWWMKDHNRDELGEIRSNIEFLAGDYESLRQRVDTVESRLKAIGKCCEGMSDGYEAMEKSMKQEASG